MITKSKLCTSASLRAIVTTIAFLVTASLVAPAYACHTGKPHGRDKTPCPNPLAGVDSFNEAYFNDQYLDTDIQVFRRQDSATLTAGDYVEQGAMGTVRIATDDLSRLADSKRNAGMCGVMDTASPLDVNANGPFLSIPDEFSYGWTDDCSDGLCTVEVSLSFSGQDVIDLTSGQSDQLVLVMRTNVSSPPGQLEPFLTPRKVSISSLLATYNRIGTSRPLVNCQFEPQGWGGPVMWTFPLQQ